MENTKLDWRSSLGDLFWNKFFIAFLVFVIWMLLFDKYRVPIQMKLSQRIENLERDKAYYQQETVKIERELEDLSENLERYARERYFMKKPNEEVFIIENN